MFKNRSTVDSQAQSLAAYGAYTIAEWLVTLDPYGITLRPVLKSLGQYPSVYRGTWGRSVVRSNSERD